MAEWRNLVCGVIIIVAPSSLTAQNTDRGLLHNNGGTWLNGSSAPATSAIFPDALIQTQKDHLAEIDTDGSSVMVQPETMVQFEVDELVLDHGFLQLTTARQLRVRVNCITVIPLTADRTQYDVIDVDGKVKVIAYKNDVKIHAKSSLARKAKSDESSDVIVREGHQSSRDERCGAAAKPADGVSARGAILNGWWVRGAGIGALGALCILLCNGDDPISPWKP